MRTLNPIFLRAFVPLGTGELIKDSRLKKRMNVM
jgi:hypothetical protein